MAELKTPKEWSKATGIEVLDADGWRGVNGRDFGDEISEEEFRYRASISTIRSTKPVWNESPEEALDKALEGDLEVRLSEDEDPEES